jgi:hypothetical protein
MKLTVMTFLCEMKTYKWFKRFKNGKTSMDEDEQSG